MDENTVNAHWLQRPANHQEVVPPWKQYVKDWAKYNKWRHEECSWQLGGEEDLPAQRHRDPVIVDMMKTRAKLDCYRSIKGQTVGSLTFVNDMPEDFYGKNYKVQCSCGNTETLPSPEIRLRGRLHTCGALFCTARPKLHNVWRWPAATIEFQIRTLALFYPDELISVWGGKEGEDKVKINDAIIAAVHELAPLCNTLKAQVWMQRDDPDLPYMPGNIHMSSRVPRNFLHLDNIPVKAAGSTFTVNELMSLTHLSEREVINELIFDMKGKKILDHYYGDNHE